MKLNKKSGFSLAESIISMMLLVLVIMITMASITKKKLKPISQQTVSGSYACWQDGSQLNQLQYNGNLLANPDTIHPASCELELDRRVRKYYVLAVGSRRCVSGECVDGQVKQDTVNTSSGEDENKMKLEFILGNNSGTHTGRTIVKQGSENKLTAIGGIFKNSSGIVSGNIEMCKYIDGNPCTDGNPKCVTDEDGKGLTINCTKDGITNPDSYTIEDIGSDKKLIKISGYNDQYTGKFNTQAGLQKNDPDKPVTIKILEKNSSLKATPNNDTKKSEFGKFLMMIPKNRQNGLTDALIDYYFGDSGEKSGVVLIFW